MKKIGLLVFLCLFPLISFAASGEEHAIAPYEYPAGDCPRAGGAGDISDGLNLTPPDCDVSVRYLGYVFGPMNGNGGGVLLRSGGSQVLAQMFRVFNSAVLALGAFIMLYILVVSTLNTAQEGEVLGKKWSSIWIPLRSAIGVALLIPQASGYSVLQTVIIWLVIQGVGAADSVWNSVLRYVAWGGVAVTQGQQAQTNTTAAIGQILKSEVCMYALQEVINKKIAPDQPPLIFDQSVLNEKLMGDSQPNYPGKIDFPGIVYDGDQAIDDYVGACGSITWSNATDDGKSPLNDTKNQAIISALSAVSRVAQDIVASGEAQELLLDDDKAGDSTIQSVLESNTTVLIGASQNYQSGMLPVLNSYADKEGKRTTDFTNAASQEGWIMAGKYYLDLSRLNTQLYTKSSNQNPKAMPSRSYKIGAALCENGNSCEDADNVNKLLNSKVLDDYINGSIKASADKTQNGYVGDPVEDNSSLGNNAKALFSFGITEITGAFDDLMNARDSNVNPVFAVSTLGSGMINFVSMVWITGALMALAIGLGAICECQLPMFQMIANWVNWVIAFLVPIMMIMFVAGATLAYYTPLIPYILLSFSGIGWLVAIVEAMIAAPLVALGVIHPEGHEHFGKAEPAIMLLLSIFMRPTLIIFGFIAGLMMSYIGVWLINEGFKAASDVWKASIAGMSWLFALIAVLVIYTGLVVSVIHKSFSLIHVIPDEVLRWIGGQGKSIFGEAEGGKKAEENLGGAMKGAGGVGEKVQEQSSAYIQEKSQGGDDKKGAGLMTGKLPGGSGIPDAGGAQEAAVRAGGTAVAGPVGGEVASKAVNQQGSDNKETQLDPLAGMPSKK